MLVYSGGKAIIEEAVSWVMPQPGELCLETGTNRGECIDKISEIFNGKVVAEAYCAKFVWVVCQNALGENNKLPKIAGAKAMLDAAKKTKGLVVDRTPKPGSVFYRKSTAAGATGHMGIVVWGDDKYFYTVEGNTQFCLKAGIKCPDLTQDNPKLEGVGSHYIPYSDISSKGYEFIHTEYLLGDEQVDVTMNPIKKGTLITADSFNLDNTNIYIYAGLILATLGAWYYFKKK
jgi:LPXTG-motif cell wall-anchored protein